MECEAEAMINQNGLSLISNSEFFALKRRFFCKSHTDKGIKTDKEGRRLRTLCNFQQALES